MREDIKFEPFDQAKYEAGFQAITDEVDAKVLEQMLETAKLYTRIENAIINWSNDETKTAGELTREILKLIK